MAAGPDFFRALQGQQGAAAPAPPPQAPGAIPSPPGAGPSQVGGAGMAADLAAAIENVNAVLDQMLQTGVPIDPDAVAVPLDTMAKNLAMVAARDGGGQTTDEASQLSSAGQQAAAPQTQQPGPLPPA